MTNSSHDSHQVQLRIGHLLSARQARFILVTCALAGIAAAWAWAGRLATLATVVLFILGTLVLELGIGLTRTTRKASRERLAAGLSSFLCEVVVHVVGSRRPGKLIANALSACFQPWVPVPRSPPLLLPMLRIAR